MTGMKANPVVVGITGASGAVMARATVDALLRRDIPTVALCSNAARLVWQEELGTNFNDMLVEWQEHPSFVHYAINDLRAPVASGTSSLFDSGVVMSVAGVVIWVAAVVAFVDRGVAICVAGVVAFVDRGVADSPSTAPVVVQATAKNRPAPRSSAAFQFLRPLAVASDTKGIPFAMLPPRSRRPSCAGRTAVSIIGSGPC